MELLLNEYENLRELGQGSFAKIYKVRHLKLDYIRAIRILNTVVTDKNDKSYQTFLNECRALLQLGNGGHPNIVRIYQPRLLQNHALVEMDYIDGCDLGDYLEQQARFISIKEVMRFVLEIAGALAYCHVDCYEYLYDRNKEYEYKLESKFKGKKFKIATDPNDGKKDLITDLQRRELVREYGVIHNDLHSKNIMRKSYDGSFVLLDFGLAIQDGECVKASSRRDGAVEYKAPEKSDNEYPISERSDIYSFGILMYEMLAGRVPFPYEREKFSSENQAQWHMELQHKNAAPPPIEPLRRAAFEAGNPGKTYEKDYPDWLEQVIMKCLEKNPEKRYANAKELFKEVEKRQLTNREAAYKEIISNLKIRSDNLYKNLTISTREKAEMEKKIESLTESLNRANDQLNVGTEKPETQPDEKPNKKPKRKINPVWIVLCFLFAGLFAFYCIKYYSLPNDSDYQLPDPYELSDLNDYQLPGQSKTDEVVQVTTHAPKSILLHDIKLLYITGGTYIMGSPESEMNRSADETQHSVTLNDFYLSEKAITNEQYSLFLNENKVPANGRHRVEGFGEQLLVFPHSWGVKYVNDKWQPTTSEKPDYPIVNVTWYGAKAYCDWINGRLPTEAEWEYACRAGSTTPFNTGANLTTSQANYDGNIPYGENEKGVYLGQPQPVGNYPPNAWGLYEMHGNVWEWCSDWYGKYTSDAVTNPQGPSAGSHRVLNGGGWSSGAGYCRSASRYDVMPNLYGSFIGFRPAASLERKTGTR